MAETAERPESRGYQAFTMALSVFALAGVGAQAVLKLDAETAAILQLADDLVCGVFLLDFVVTVVRARDRWGYLRTWGWLDLISSIPMVDLARWGRVGRVVRATRVLRGLHATKVVAGAVSRYRAKNTLLAASLISFVFVIVSSIAVLHFESTPEANILKADDALWWAFGTLTTVGYGDYFPVTGEGRVVAGILMTAGVGLVGTFSGFFAAWLMGPREESPDSELAELRKEVAALKEAIHQLTAQRERSAGVLAEGEVVDPRGRCG